MNMKLLLVLVLLWNLALAVDSFKVRVPKVAVACIAGLCLQGVGVSDATPLKRTGLNSAEITRIVAADITERQALITADFSRDVYSEQATFKDEIDTYPIDKYVQGTKALFDASKSHVDLVGEVITKDKDSIVTFKFAENLCFNIPILKPIVFVSGYVELFRDEQGLIYKSVEHWDQPVGEVLKTVKF